MWGEAIDSQVTRVEAGVWLVGGISVERMCSSHVACEQGAGLCRSQQATGASGGQGGGCVSLGCFWWGRGVAPIPIFSPCARLLLAGMAKGKFLMCSKPSWPCHISQAEERGRFHQRL